ncbi:hypothetical protein JW756_05885 [Candidatus Woesearchaeota archaeon]|nr:hypothetical protein [Candidatus Woesearchaeota archaeon]
MNEKNDRGPTALQELIDLQRITYQQFKKQNKLKPNTPPITCLSNRIYKAFYFWKKSPWTPRRGRPPSKPPCTLKFLIKNFCGAVAGGGGFLTGFVALLQEDTFLYELSLPLASDTGF